MGMAAKAHRCDPPASGRRQSKSSEKHGESLRSVFGNSQFIAFCFRDSTSKVTCDVNVTRISRSCQISLEFLIQKLEELTRVAQHRGLKQTECDSCFICRGDNRRCRGGTQGGRSDKGSSTRIGVEVGTRDSRRVGGVPESSQLRTAATKGRSMSSSSGLSVRRRMDLEMVGDDESPNLKERTTSNQQPFWRVRRGASRNV